jgi:hypothetical protein
MVYTAAVTMINNPEPENGLRVPEELTPLAAVRPALPFLRALGRLLSNGPIVEKLAVLKTLAAEDPGPWTIEQLKDRISWLEPGSVVQVVDALRRDGVIEHQRTLRRHVLTDEGRTAILLIDLLCQPGDRTTVIREVDALMAHALARGAAFKEVLHYFQIGVAHLRGARDELEELLATDTRAALLAAAERASVYGQHMQDIIERHREVLGKHELDADAGPALTRASELVPAVAQLVYRAHDRLVEHATELRRFGVRIDRDTVRELLAESSTTELAALISSRVRPAPSVPAVDIDAAAKALADRLRRETRPSFVPPPPRGLPLVVRTESKGPLQTLADQLAALEEPATLASFVVDHTWGSAVTSHAQLLQVLGRRASGLPVLKLTSSATEDVMRGGVWRVAAATIEPARHAEEQVE